MSDPKTRIETKALHAGHEPDSQTRSRAVPIYQTVAYTFENTDHARSLFALEQPGYIYTRIGNPTTEALENRLAALHGAAGCVATASGMSAVFYAVCSITSAGQNFVTGSNIYDGSRSLFLHTLSRFGIEARFVDTSDPANVAAAIDENTRLVYTECVGNPRCNVDDLPAIAKVAHDHGLPFMVDATTTPPPILDAFDPKGVNADVAVYSLTKIIGGHGTSMGGAIVERGGFDWSASGRYPEMTEPDPAYHGLKFYEALKGTDEEPGPVLATKIRAGLLRDVGAAPAPMNSFQIIQGIETLPLRAERHCANADKVARFLEGHKAVAWVNYAGLESHPDYGRAKKLFPMGPSALFGFGVRGGLEAGRTFIESVQVCSHLANILDAKTLVVHPATTTHSQSGPEAQQRAGVTEDMVRISVGLEHIDDILADLDQALKASQK